MRFHLSTLLLAMVIVALGLGWYLDHNDPRRTEIVGSWHSPFDGQLNIIGGYWTSLIIRHDGTFLKTQISRNNKRMYEGTYLVEKNGLITFHVTSKTNEIRPAMTAEELVPAELDAKFPTLRDEMRESLKPQTETIDCIYKIRCAVDKTGYLLIDSQSWFHLNEGKDCGIRWEQTFQRSK